MSLGTASGKSGVSTEELDDACGRIDRHERTRGQTQRGESARSFVTSGQFGDRSQAFALADHALVPVLLLVRASSKSVVRLVGQ